MTKNPMICLFILVILGLSHCSSAIACNCGCKNGSCSNTNENIDKKIKKLKPLCETPKGWLLATEKSREEIKHVCGSNCNIEGEKK